jgi:hypothetical protein
MKSFPSACRDERVALARRGTLGTAEWQDFATHLTGCADCRIAWRLAVDFDHADEARVGDERLVARAVAAAALPVASAHRRGLRVAVAAAAILLVVGGASAAIAWRAHRLRAGLLSNPRRQ